MAEKREQGAVKEREVKPADVAKKSGADATQKRTATAKKTTSTTAKKTTTAAKSTATAKKTASTAAKKTSTAKKTTSATEKSTPTAKKTTGTATKQSTAAKRTATTGAKKTATTAKKPLESTFFESTATVEENGAAPTTNAVPSEAPSSEALAGSKSLTFQNSQKDIMEGDERALGDAHPPVDFPEATPRSLFLRLVLLLAVAAVLVASVFIYKYRPVAFTAKTTSVNFLYQPESDTTHIVVNGTVRGTARGTLFKAASSGRGDICAAIIGKHLYLVNGKHVFEIAEDVLDFTLSASGKALAYRVESSHLYYRGTGKKDEPSLISVECQDDAYSLSSNGKELIYVATEGNGVSSMRVESYSGNRPYIENTVGLTPVAISDDCAYIYYLDGDGALFIFESKASRKIKCSADPDLSSFIFNRDFTELLFTENGDTVLYKKGEFRQIVGAATMELQLLPNRRVSSCTLPYGMQYMTSSFLGSYFLNTVGEGKKLTYLDGKGNLTDVSFVDDGDTVTVTDKGVYFLLTSISGEDSHRILYFVGKGKTEIQRIDWDVTNYCTNVDGSRVMYTGYQNALYTYRAETGAVRLCDSIIPESLTVTEDDLFCFYRERGELFVSDNGGEPRSITTDVVGYFVVDASALLYATSAQEDGTFTVFANYRNQRVSDLVLEGVSMIDVAK